MIFHVSGLWTTEEGIERLYEHEMCGVVVFEQQNVHSLMFGIGGL